MVIVLNMSPVRALQKCNNFFFSLNWHKKFAYPLVPFLLLYSLSSLPRSPQPISMPSTITETYEEVLIKKKIIWAHTQVKYCTVLRSFFVFCRWAQLNNNGFCNRRFLFFVDDEIRLQVIQVELKCSNAGVMHTAMIH